jgi:hypothetical protein
MVMDEWMDGWKDGWKDKYKVWFAERRHLCRANIMMSRTGAICAGVGGNEDWRLEEGHSVKKISA